MIPALLHPICLVRFPRIQFAVKHVNLLSVYQKLTAAAIARQQHHVVLGGSQTFLPSFVGIPLAFPSKRGGRGGEGGGGMGGGRGWGGVGGGGCFYPPFSLKAGNRNSR